MTPRIRIFTDLMYDKKTEGSSHLRKWVTETAVRILASGGQSVTTPLVTILVKEGVRERLMV